MSNKKKYIGEVEEAKADNSALKVNQGIEQPPQVNPNFRKFKRIKKDLTVSDYVEGIVAGDVNILSQAITLVESRLAKHQEIAQEIIKKWLASEDLNKNIPEPKPKKIVNLNDKLIKMREEYPNAYMPWEEKDDRKLVKQFSSGKTIEQLSVLLGRHQGSIKSRLKKHLGDDIFDI